MQKAWRDAVEGAGAVMEKSTSSSGSGQAGARDGPGVKVVDRELSGCREHRAGSHHKSAYHRSAWRCSSLFLTLNPGRGGCPATRGTKFRLGLDLHVSCSSDMRFTSHRCQHRCCTAAASCYPKQRAVLCWALDCWRPVS